MTDTYYYGQGRVEAAPIINGVVGKYRWINDVSAMSIALSIEKVEHKESYSGQKALVRSFPVGKTATLNMTLHSINVDNLAMVLYGTPIHTPAGTVTGEDLGMVNIGDTIRLNHIGVSNLGVTDGSQPIDPVHYDVVDEGKYGEVNFISLPQPTMALSANYAYAARREVGLFTAPQPTVAIRYKGINIAEGNAPVLIELYKVATDPLTELALITDGTTVAGMPISGGILLDTSKPANGPLGQFGYIAQLG